MSFDKFSTPGKGIRVGSEEMILKVANAQRVELTVLTSNLN